MALNTGRTQLMPAPRMGRKMRNPTHTFQLKVTPYVIQPFMIAPVLPGETLDHMLYQCRVVSDPVANPLVGWHLEFYWFYVKLRDLDARDTLTAMIVDPSTSLSSIHDTGDDASTFYAGDSGYVNWVAKCRKRIVDCYFRDGTDVEATYLLNTDEPVAQLKGNSWLDSVVPAASMTAYDVHVPLYGDLAAGGTEDYASAADIVTAIERYQQAQMAGLTNLSYEEYLLQEGIQTKAPEEHRPELLRMQSYWSYPTNTVNPSTGAPSSALSWAPSGRADKSRFFREPGFIVGITVTRPKVYLGNQTSHAAMLMNKSTAWLPSVLSGDPASSLVNVAQGKGPLQNATDSGGYWVDIRDLLVYGDQFMNFAPDITGATVDAALPLPSTAIQKRYVTDITWIEGLFTGGSSAAKVRYDGVCALSIKSRQSEDFAPTVNTRLR